MSLLSADGLINVINVAADCRPGTIAQSLALREPKCQETAAYCHSGREPYTKDGQFVDELFRQLGGRRHQVAHELTLECLCRFGRHSVTPASTGIIHSTGQF